MKSKNLYSSIYEHSFSILLTFSFYTLVFSLLLSWQEDEAFSSVKWNEHRHITDDKGTTYSVGYHQISASNQDSFVEKRDSSGNILWKISHAASSADERAILITLDDKENPWVVFTVEGGETADESFFTEKFITPGAFKNVSQNAYNQKDEGSTKIAVVTCLDPEDGKILKGSFLTTLLDHKNIDALTVKKIGVHHGNILLEAETTTRPSYETDEHRNHDTFQLQLSMNSNLSEILRSEIKE